MLEKLTYPKSMLQLPATKMPATNVNLAPTMGTNFAKMGEEMKTTSA